MPPPWLGDGDGTFSVGGDVEGGGAKRREAEVAEVAGCRWDEAGNFRIGNALWQRGSMLELGLLWRIDQNGCTVVHYMRCSSFVHRHRLKENTQKQTH